MQNQPLKVTRKPIAELIPAPYNPRKPLAPGSSQYRKLKRSLEEFGLVEPLVWNRRTGHVVGGHQRLHLLRELGWTEVPVTTVDLPAEQEKALNVVLNNREAQSDWDLPRLRDLLDELAAGSAAQLRASGFEPSQLRLLHEELAPADTPRAEEQPTVCEVTLVIPAGRYDEARPALDRLLDQTGLEAHVRWR